MAKSQNLLIILSDEHQARAMGCAGSDFVQTPHLDALAAEGCRFTNAYTPSPICVPARASFATGQYVHQCRNWDNAMPYTGAVRGWGHVLQDAGVPVESIGKLHYRDEADPSGFDHQHIPMHVLDGIGMAWALPRKEHERARGEDRRRMLGPDIGPGQSAYTSYDASVTQRSVEWIKARAHDAAPWCLQVGLVAPHFPLVVPQEFYDLYPLASLPEPKLHPSKGYKRHPWVEKQNAFMNSEARFENAEERLAAMAAYYGLCSWLDYNIGLIIAALKESGRYEDTTIIYTSDHGDNLGARGLWGKSNMYQESAHIPMIAKGAAFPTGLCETPVSLRDLSVSIPAHFGLSLDADDTAPLQELAAGRVEPERVIFSEYHAVGSVSGAYMLRKGRWKLHYYIGFPPELFDLEADPEELTDLGGDPAFADQVAQMEAELRKICDPEAVDALAFADQAAMIEALGGYEAAMGLGASGATPAPEV